MLSKVTERELYQTPTWVIAGVCFIFIVVALVLEKMLHMFRKAPLTGKKKAVLDAIEKIESELILLGLIYLLTEFASQYILMICVPSYVVHTMLPCTTASFENEKSFDHRFLSETSDTVCKVEGYVQLFSSETLHKSHKLIFFLAIFHVFYSFFTLTLGKLKIRRWKNWENETSSYNPECIGYISRPSVREGTSFYIRSFFGQFFISVGRRDYLTLRNGFIAVHVAPGSQLNFHKFIKRCLQDDFKLIVGVKLVLWISFLLFILFNVKDFNPLYITSSIPFIIILAVGTKLQVIMKRMVALGITDKDVDEYFWFGRPKFTLHLIHFAVFQNMYHIIYFFWIWISFGKRSCYQPDFKIALIIVAISLGVPVLCSYSALPLYSLLTQMGSLMKKSIFDSTTERLGGDGSVSHLDIEELPVEVEQDKLDIEELPVEVEQDKLDIEELSMEVEQDKLDTEELSVEAEQDKLETLTRKKKDKLETSTSETSRDDEHFPFPKLRQLLMEGGYTKEHPL